MYYNAVRPPAPRSGHMHVDPRSGEQWHFGPSAQPWSTATELLILAFFIK